MLELVDYDLSCLITFSDIAPSCFDCHVQSSDRKGQREPCATRNTHAVFHLG